MKIKDKADQGCEENGAQFHLYRMFLQCTSRFQIDKFVLSPTFAESIRIGWMHLLAGRRGNKARVRLNTRSDGFLFHCFTRKDATENKTGISALDGFLSINWKE